MAAAPGRRVRAVLRNAGLAQPHRASGPDVRFYRGACPRLRRRGKGGQPGHAALGRSRGGFSTEIHLKSGFEGLPITFHLTGGEASDSPLFKLLDLGPDVKPRAALADKGYDAKANRVLARARGIAPAIPFKSNEKDRPAFFPKVLYKCRVRIEQCFGKLKRFKRVAPRCEKTERSFTAIVALAFSFILIKSVHTA
nr:IS5 family transposase [Ancylobacter crimeensis]